MLLRLLPLEGQAAQPVKVPVCKHAASLIGPCPLHARALVWEVALWCAVCLGGAAQHCC